MLFFGLLVGMALGVLAGSYLWYRLFVHEMGWWDLEKNEIEELKGHNASRAWEVSDYSRIHRLSFLCEMFSAYHGTSIFHKLFVIIGSPIYGFLRIFQELQGKRFERRFENRF